MGFFDDLFGRLTPRPPIDVFGGQGLDAFGELMGDGSDALQPITPFGPSGGFLGGLGGLSSSSPAFWQMPQLGGDLGYSDTSSQLSLPFKESSQPRGARSLTTTPTDTFTPRRPGLFSTKPAATTGAATPSTTASGPAGDIWGVIDEEARDDPRLAQALKLAVQLESGGRADAVGDQGQSHGFYQIHQPAHGRNITPEQSRDPRRATQYRLAEFRASLDRVAKERPGLWEANPMEAAALTAFLAQRPAQMYGAANVQQAWQTIQQRQQAPPAQAAPQTFRTGGQWDHLVPGGQGRIERGGTHGGHPAIDIFAPAGTPIRSPVDGVSTPGVYPLGGNASTLRGSDGKWYYFAHAQAPMRGGPVRKGDIIGYVGNSGNAAQTKSHLHYAVATSADAFERFNGSGDIDPD